MLELAAHVAISRNLCRVAPACRRGKSGGGIMLLEQVSGAIVELDHVRLHIQETQTRLADAQEDLEKWQKKMAERTFSEADRQLQAALKKLIAACQEQLNALSDQEAALLSISKPK
jgi:hypothetical protein